METPFYLIRDLNFSSANTSQQFFYVYLLLIHANRNAINLCSIMFRLIYYPYTRRISQAILFRDISYIFPLFFLHCNAWCLSQGHFCKVTGAHPVNCPLLGAEARREEVVGWVKGAHANSYCTSAGQTSTPGGSRPSTPSAWVPTSTPSRFRPVPQVDPDQLTKWVQTSIQYAIVSGSRPEPEQYTKCGSTHVH